MPNYLVKNDCYDSTRGIYYKAGQVVELTKEEAARVLPHLEVLAKEVPTAIATDSKTDAYEDMNYQELLALVRERGIKMDGRAREDLIRVLRIFDQANAGAVLPEE